MVHGHCRCSCLRLTLSAMAGFCCSGLRLALAPRRRTARTGCSSAILSLMGWTDCLLAGCVRRDAASSSPAAAVHVSARHAVQVRPTTLAQSTPMCELKSACGAQASAFGAFLDVAVDCLSRAVVWTWAVGPAAAVPVTLELLTFVCTHKARLHPSAAVLPSGRSSSIWKLTAWHRCTRELELLAFPALCGRKPRCPEVAWKGPPDSCTQVPCAPGRWLAAVQGSGAVWRTGCCWDTKAPMNACSEGIALCSNRLPCFSLVLDATGAGCLQGGGAAWRTGCFRDAPAWVQAVMADGFKTAPGAAAVAGLFGAPLWLWARRFLPGTPCASPALGAFLVAGRLLAAAVECWVVARHVRGLLREDARGNPGPDHPGAGQREE